MRRNEMPPSSDNHPFPSEHHFRPQVRTALPTLQLPQAQPLPANNIFIRSPYRLGNRRRRNLSLSSSQCTTRRHPLLCLHLCLCFRNTTIRISVPVMPQTWTSPGRTNTSSTAFYTSSRTSKSNSIICRAGSVAQGRAPTATGVRPVALRALCQTAPRSAKAASKTKSVALGASPSAAGPSAKTLRLQTRPAQCLRHCRHHSRNSSRYPRVTSSICIVHS
ncbi:hypothetical protein BX661DRAFT_67403 [Kickxella alabastrina]|uniref:uncharacterized protein n=1 Tax=Kickxella alabastrina TaxID=61397 RepID=UPI002220C328|nr:uncharacterized protein BX661DRAFT_67403 [Kickxella alabastrina]KAI7821453.1 hypothetical protein BX661DRAFT_67403 [Kickxella alabastrina]